MIVTELYNGQGLGNQLFCYITTRVIALDSGRDFGVMGKEKFKGHALFDLDFGKPVIGGSGPEGGPPTALPDGIVHYYAEQKLTHPKSKADIRVYDRHLVNVPDNTKIDGVMQDEQYLVHRRAEIKQWLKVRPSAECTDYASPDVCVINFRGGEYVGAKDLFLPQRYWDDAIAVMRGINPDFRFVVVTDDTQTAKQFFPDFEVIHLDSGRDYSVVHHAHYLILSNSSFAWFPAWLSDNLQYCIAPKYWARHNISDGYWSCMYNVTTNWHYLDREGNIIDYVTAKQEIDTYIDKHPRYFPTTVEANYTFIPGAQPGAAQRDRLLQPVAALRSLAVRIREILRTKK